MAKRTAPGLGTHSTPPWPHGKPRVAMGDRRHESPTEGSVCRCLLSVWGVSGAQESLPWLGTSWSLAEVHPQPSSARTQQVPNRGCLESNGASLSHLPTHPRLNNPSTRLRTRWPESARQRGQVEGGRWKEEGFHLPDSRGSQVRSPLVHLLSSPLCPDSTLERAEMMVQLQTGTFTHVLFFSLLLCWEVVLCSPWVPSQ